MKKAHLCIVLFFTSFLHAQQDAQYSQNRFNILPINPATAGMKQMYCATALYRSQWVSFPGQPRTGLVSLEAPSETLHGGTGLTVLSDQLGFEKSFSAKLAYAYHIYKDNCTLGFGADAGIHQKSLNGNWVAIDPTDNSIPYYNTRSSVADISIGTFYIRERMYAGLSATHLLNENFADKSFKLRGVRHYYFTAGYVFYAGTPGIELKPSVFVKSDEASTQIDLNLTAEFRKRLWLGTSFRLQDAIVLMAGVYWNGMKIGYAYDVNVSSLHPYNSGTHEILLGYCFRIPYLPTIHQNPRVLL